MNDRERVLLNIAVDVAGSVHDRMEQLDGGWCLRFTFGRPAAQFIPLELADRLEQPLKPGDIVRCQTNPNHAWGISEFVESFGNSTYLLRLIGGKKLLRMRNERLEVMRFEDPSRVYTGAKHRVFRWASQAAFLERYNPDADYFKCCGGIEFQSDLLIIWCRPHIWRMEKKAEDGTVLYAQPKKFAMTWSERTKLKDIVSAMRSQGFGQDFEYGPSKPTEGQAGYFTVTRDDLLAAIGVKRPSG